MSRETPDRTPVAPACLVAGLDDIDVGILCLDAELNVVFMNRPFRDLWAIPESLAQQRLVYRDLVNHVETRVFRNRDPNPTRANLGRRERAIRAGSLPPTLIELPDGRMLRFCCSARKDGSRILTYLDVTAELRRGGETVAKQIGAELRFATETLETQAAYLVALAEETEETRKRADLARTMLEREIEERRTIEAQLRHVATTDSLTGVLNRAAFLSVADRELSRTRRANEDLAILMLDADHFKLVNDRYGHAGGDAVLEYLANACRSAIRIGDSIGRLGGEEFAIVLPCATLEIGETMAERLRGRIAEQEVWHGGETIFVTVSVGIGLARPTDRSIEQVIARADAALYAAKKAGRNRVVLEAAA
ncbi:sensor domain-containing diguanylate cyclase [Rhodopila sp.]|uniref:sensor domain-containing diguanylate cyclase n=1 Tax=Rhodopila sp. TaxID=2480087 RepID=UPI002D7EC7F9|nr:diguanylate cyclase [Rhodopila sp.]